MNRGAVLAEESGKVMVSAGMDMANLLPASLYHPCNIVKTAVDVGDGRALRTVSALVISGLA